MKYMVMAGSLSDGWRAVGPFDSFDGAAEYADRELACDKWVMELNEPEGWTKEECQHEWGEVQRDVFSRDRKGNPYKECRLCGELDFDVTWEDEEDGDDD